MILEHIGLSQINGSLVVLDGVKGVQYDEMAELHLDDGSTRVGRVVRVDGDRCVIQVFEGTRGLSLVNNRTVLTGHPMMMDLSPELLGRVLDGLGRPIDGLGDIYPVARRDVNGAPINPVSRVYPRNYIHTGISSIDCLATLIRASGHGVAQTVRIGKAIADDFCGKADDFKMLSSIQHQDIPFGRTLAPVVVPLAKSAYSLGAMVNPGKMVSF